MKRFAVAATVVALLVLPRVADSATIAIMQVLNYPANYDGKHVSVSGTVRHLQHKTASDGAAWVTFGLCASACINVFTGGSPQLREGRVILVRGTFAAEKHFNGYTFRDAIHADPGSL
ncbi:MAG TPA: hypothetical protein VGI19_07000 [Candidatus Cybelea sp.]